MNDYTEFGYDDIDTFEDGGLIEHEKEIDEVERLFKEARKEYRQECKARHSDYKFIKKI